MRIAAALGGLTAIVLTGCVASATATPASTPAAPATPTPEANVHAIADWAPVIQFDGVMYGEVSEWRTLFTEADLGPVLHHVDFKMIDNAGIGYRIKDGDAAYLEVGTPVHALRDYDPRFRLAAVSRNRVEVYQVTENPRAQSGADLLDIEGRVRSITVTSGTSQQEELQVITDRDKVDSLIAMVLSAPVRESERSGMTHEHRRLRFQLDDGTMLGRSYSLDTGEFGRGIFPGKAFQDFMEALSDPAPPGHHELG